jgi:TonB family protein
MRGITSLMCAAALWALARPAHGQSTRVEGPAEQPMVTPPRVVADSPATYPVQALRDRVIESVTVVLILEIDAAGAVGSAIVEQPMGHGFDEASTVAARKLHFQPAQRGSRAVPSRIKFRYVFHPPPATLSAQVLDAVSGAPIPAASVVVHHGDHAEQGLTSESGGFRQVVERAAGSGEVSVGHVGYEPRTVPIELNPGEQLSLVLHLMPTVTPEKPAKPKVPAHADEVIEVTVRGERPAPGVVAMTRQQVRELPGAFGDPFRAIEALPGVTPVVSGLPFFYVRGAPPGDVGYFLDGVRVPYLYHLLIGPSVVQPAFVDRVELYPGAYPARLGRFAGGIVSAETTPPRVDLHGEGNLRLYDVGAMSEAGFADGRGTVALGARYSYTAALMSLVAPDLRLDYRDYQARVTYDVTDRDRMSVISFGSYDLLARDGPNGLNILFGTEFYRLEVRHEHSTSEGALTSAVTVGYDRTHPPGTERNVSNRSIAGRIGGHTKVSASATLRAGADVQIDAFASDKAPYGDPEDPQTKSFDTTFAARRDLTAGTWADLVLRLHPGIELTPGIRLDRYQSGSASAFAVEPRLAARFDVTTDVTLIHTLGIAHQPPAFFLPLPGLNPGELEGGLQRAIQASAGMELDLPSDFALTTTLFHNIFLNMNDALGTDTDDESGVGIDQRSLGTAYGLEIYLRRSLTKRLGGFVSYTLSRSTRSLEQQKVLSAFDRTHVLNAALTGDLGRSWRAGARLLFYTGTPVDDSASGEDSRNPPFYRVDVRLEKRWALSQTAWLAFVAEGLNVTLSKEMIGGEEIGPITVPNIGLEGGF